MAGWHPEYRAAVEAAAAKRKQAAKDRAERKARLRWIHRHSATYTPPKLLYGRWKGMTMAEVWKVMKTERDGSRANVAREAQGADGARMTPERSAANLEVLRAMHRAQRDRGDDMTHTE